MVVRLIKTVKSNDELELLEKKLKKRDIGRPDHGLAGTRDICAEIGTFPQKAGQVATLTAVVLRGLPSSSAAMACCILSCVQML